MKEKVGIALFGFGRIGQIHFKSFLTNRCKLNILYVVDESTEALKKVLEENELSSTKIVHFDDTDTVLADERLEAIVICTPTNTHTKLILKALRAGKHVMSEKPIALDIKSTEECYAEAEKSGKHLFCAINRRFDPGYVKMKEKIANGTIGYVQLVQAYVRDHPEPAGNTLGGLGNLIHDMGIHMMDTVAFVLGEGPIEVYTQTHAHSEAYRERGDFDVIAVLMKFPSGAIAYSDSCRYAPYGYDQRLEVVGSKGALVFDTPKEDGVILRNPEGEHHSPMDFSFPQRFSESYRLELEHFIELVQGKVESRVPASVMLSAARMIEAAVKSAETKAPVKI